MGNTEETTSSARAGVYRRANRPIAAPVEPSHALFTPPVAATGRSLPPPHPAGSLPAPQPAPPPTAVALDDAAFASVGERPTRPALLLAGGVLVLGLLAAASTLIIAGGDGGTQLGTDAETSAPDTSAAPASAPSTAGPASTAAAPSSAPSAAPVETTAAAPSTTATTAAAASTTSAAELATSAPATTAAAVSPVTLAGRSDPTVLVVYNGASVIIDGAVPTQEAADLLETLAVANAKGPAVVTSRVTIDPAVPADVGIRVIELESLRFPSGSTEIVAEHAVEFDRVANVMNLLPHATVLVVGHADQLGPEDVNLTLSQGRADAVVAYLVSQGISVDRLSAVGVGETDLLAEDLGEDTLALNRRTEFVFYGLLVPTP